MSPKAKKVIDAESETVAVSVSVDDACRRLGIGRTSMEILLKDREIRSFKIGSRRLIPETELQRFVRERMEAAQ